MSAGPEWRIAVDTGGTFTDCLAVDRSGRCVRAKVLSSGALRVAVAERPDSSSLVVSLPEVFADGFFAGWEMEVPGGSVPIAGSVGNRLELAREIPDSGPAGGNEVLLRSLEDATVMAVRMVTQTVPGQELPEVALRLATTRGTNALLERKGARVALFVTRGFADLLEIGNQQRPDLFALDIRKAEPLSATVVEVEERLDASGEVLRALDEATLAREADRLVLEGFDSAAIAFMHSFRNPGPEDRAEQVLAAAGFRHVSRSSHLSRRIKILPRTQTALVDAYLAGILETYLESVARSLGPGHLHVMTSAGALVSARDYRPKDSLLSGPAAGVVGAVAAGRRSGCERILAFDMGGTSTDVSRFDTELELRTETAVGDVRLLSPSVAVETVAAGGGSICRWQAGRIQVGPESAGARPGPACYGAGGPLTVTDVNLLLGRLVPSRFPFRVDLEAANRRASEVAARVPGFRDQTAAEPPNREELLAGLLAIANERMAGAIRAISTRRGYDPSEYTLVAFGGAGAQHAARMAELLGMRRVLIPEDGALLSAAGLLAGAFERSAERQVLEPLRTARARLGRWFDDLGREAGRALEVEGVAAGEIEVGCRTVFLRYQGQESVLAVNYGTPETLVEDFEQLYLARYGYLPETRTLEVESLRVSMRSTGEEPLLPWRRPGGAGSREPTSIQSFWDGADWVEAPVFERERLGEGQFLDGPGLIAESHTVTVVERGWRAHVDGAGGLVLERTL